jgi:hypothetical protein
VYVNISKLFKIKYQKNKIIIFAINNIMTSGIYKWVSPTNRIYVGQSKNLKQREEWYRGGGVSRTTMTKLKRSFNKHGVNNHKFEIIEYCDILELNNKEIYWGLYYNVLSPKGLNCKLGNQNCLFSEETKQKMREAKLGKKQSPEHLAKRVKAHTGTTRNNHPILQYDLQGNFIKEWDSISQAGNSLNNNGEQIRLVLKRGDNTIYGYKWFYKNLFTQIK